MVVQLSYRLFTQRVIVKRNGAAEFTGAAVL